MIYSSIIFILAMLTQLTQAFLIIVGVHYLSKSLKEYIEKEYAESQKSSQQSPQSLDENKQN